MKNVSNSENGGSITVVPVPKMKDVMSAATISETTRELLGFVGGLDDLMDEYYLTERKYNHLLEGNDEDDIFSKIWENDKEIGAIRDAYAHLRRKIIGRIGSTMETKLADACCGPVAI
jgi:hypothetical protein